MRPAQALPGFELFVVDRREIGMAAIARNRNPSAWTPGTERRAEASPRAKHRDRLALDHLPKAELNAVRDLSGSDRVLSISL